MRNIPPTTRKTTVLNNKPTVFYSEKESLSTSWQTPSLGHRREVRELCFFYKYFCRSCYEDLTFIIRVITDSTDQITLLRQMGSSNNSQRFTACLHKHRISFLVQSFISTSSTRGICWQRMLSDFHSLKTKYPCDNSHCTKCLPTRKQ